MIRIARGVAHRVLDEERHTGERPARVVGFGTRALEPAVYDGVQLPVDPFDSLDRGVDELTRRHFAVRDELGLGGGVEEREIVVHECAA